MAGAIFTAVTASAITFTKSSDESTSKTLLKVKAGTNQRIKILGFSIFFNEETGDATPAIPFTVLLGRHAADSGSGGSAVTLTDINSNGITPTTTATEGLSTSVTLTSVAEKKLVNAQTGYEKLFPMGQEIIVEPGEYVSLTATSGATLSTGNVSCIGQIWIEE